MLPQVLCVACRHLHTVGRYDQPTCNAFVDGIPSAILANMVDHRRAYPGDQGIRFEPAPDSEEGLREYEERSAPCFELFEIIPGLFMSGRRLDNGPSYLESGVTAVVDLHGDLEGHRPHRRHWGVFVDWPIEDGPMPDPSITRRVASLVSGLMDDGHRVLVHCHAGLNRSGLVVARALITRGMDPPKAIELVRKRRGSDALGNAAFEGWLLNESTASGGPSLM